MANTTKVITGKNTRWSYCNIWEPKTDDNGTQKYSVSLIVPKTDTATIDKLKVAIMTAYKEGASKLKSGGKSVPAFTAIRNPLRDGDAERPDDEAYHNSYFINANARMRPGVVDAACQPIIDRGEVYSGVYGRASVNFYAYNHKGNRGIACGLNNLQKLRDGEPLGGRTSAADDFAEFAEEDDDMEFLG